VCCRQGVYRTVFSQKSQRKEVQAQAVGVQKGRCEAAKRQNVRPSLSANSATGQQAEGGSVAGSGEARQEH